MKLKNKFKNSKGSITLYVLISLSFFYIMVFGIYNSASNKMQKQEKELEKVQEKYESENISDVYEETHNNYISAETPTIRVYDDETLKREVLGEKVSSKETIYLSNKHVILKFSSKNTTDKYVYSTSPNGEKTKIEGNTLEMDITTAGTTIYTYIEDLEGNYSKNYTAINMILVTLQDKTIYVEEGKETNIGEIQGENAGKITFEQIADSTIATLEENKVKGIKAGTTTFIAKEDKAEATATITIKVVKIELEFTTKTMLVGDSTKAKITGINNGILSAKINDKELATVDLKDNEIIITAKKEGNAVITITENNVNAEATCQIKIASIALKPNGGTYTMPTKGEARIETTVTTVNAEKIETTWSDNMEKWDITENNQLVEKTNCKEGTYYLYVRINGEEIYKSKEFIVGENTLAENKITIKPSTTTWTKDNITATVTYGSTLTSNKKAGYGTTLEKAITVASESTSTNLTATENGYFYAEATDVAGNKVTTSLQITKIDRTAPSVENVEIKNVNTTGYDVYVYGVQDSGSGVNRVQFPTWTDYNGQDDIQSGWQTAEASKGVKQSDGTTWVYRVNTTDHKNEAGKYYTYIYTYDNIENSLKVSEQTVTVPTVKITYDENYNSAKTTVDKAYNTELGELSTPTRTGYTFAGWYTEPTGGTQISSTTLTPADNTTYYAHWTANKYTVTYDFNGGTSKNGRTLIKSNDIQQIYDDKYNITSEPTRPGYLFVGWFSNEYKDKPLNYYADSYSDMKKEYGYDQKGLWNHYTNYGKNDGRRVSQFLSTDIAKMTNDTTVYAGWIENSYTVTINPNGGTWNSSTNSQSFTQDYNTTKTISNPTRPGYTFNGWALTKKIDNSNWVELMYQAPGYAGFENENGAKSANTIYLYSQLGQLDKFMYNGKYEFIIEADENSKMYRWSQTSNPLTTTSVQGYIDISNGFGGLVYNNTSTLLAVSTDAGNWWQAIGMYKTTTNPISRADNLWTNRPVHFYAKVANDLSNLAEYKITGALDNNSNYIFRDENVTLQAVWKANTYEISYDGNGNTGGNTESHTVTYGQNAAIATNGFTKAGYTFAGWTTKSDGTDDGYKWTNWKGTWGFVDGKYGIADGKLQLYAMWKANTYEISYNGNGNTGGNTESHTVTYGQNAAIATNGFTKAGYTFAGWTTKSDGTDDGYKWTNWKGTWGFVDGKYGIADGKLQLYAMWKANTYEISYNGNGNTGGNTESHTVTYGQNAAIATNGFTKAGYTFAGWTTKSDGTDDGYKWTNWKGTWGFVDGKYGIADGKLQLYAMWKANTYEISYNGNGNTGGNTESHTVTYGQNAAIATNGFTKTGYTFAGWTTKLDGTDDGYGWTNWKGTWKYVDGKYGISDGKLQLYAVWKDTISPTTPIIEARVNNESWTIYDGSWTNNNVYVKLTSTDDGSGIKQYEWYENGAWTTRALTTNNNKIGEITYTAQRNETLKFRAIDEAGNVSNESTLTLKIDKDTPTIGSIAGTTEKGNTGKVMVTNIADTGGSGLKGIYISTSSTKPTATNVTWEANIASSFNKTVSANGTYYVWVIDNAGNISEVKSCKVSGIVAKVTKVSLTNAIVKKGSKITINKNLEGSTEYKSISFTSGATAKATIVSATGVATGVAAGTSTITCNITNYDGTTITGTCTLTVVDLQYSPNGGSYALPYTDSTAGTATIKSTVTISGATTSQYAWTASSTTEPTSWSTYNAATGGTPSKTSTYASTYYLWNKIIDSSGNYVTYISNAFVITANKITITPSTTAMTNKDITCTIAYPSATTSSTRKAGYGTSLTLAKTTASSATAPTTSLTVTANGVVYAEATDVAGNKVTASLQINNIDKIGPSLGNISATKTISFTNGTGVSLSKSESNTSKISLAIVPANSTISYTISGGQSGGKAYISQSSTFKESEDISDGPGTYNYTTGNSSSIIMIQVHGTGPITAKINSIKSTNGTSYNCTSMVTSKLLSCTSTTYANDSYVLMNKEMILGLNVAGNPGTTNTSYIYPASLRIKFWIY